MAMLDVVSIDAWRSPDGWTWNASYRCGEIEASEIRTPRKFLAALRKAGILTAQSAGRVRVDYSGTDPETIEVQDKGTGEPLVAVTVDWAEIETNG